MCRNTSHLQCCAFARSTSASLWSVAVHRFWLTSFDEAGELIALGWRDGLRIVSEVQDLRGQLDRVVEPTVSVQEEADYYRGLSGVEGTPRLAAGVSRVWVEQYVSQGESHQDMHEDAHPQSNRNAWLADVTEDPGRPRVIRSVPARTSACPYWPSSNPRGR